MPASAIEHHVAALPAVAAVRPPRGTCASRRNEAEPSPPGAAGHEDPGVVSEHRADDSDAAVSRSRAPEREVMQRA